MMNKFVNFIDRVTAELNTFISFWMYMHWFVKILLLPVLILAIVGLILTFIIAMIGHLFIRSN